MYEEPTYSENDVLPLIEDLHTVGKVPSMVFILICGTKLPQQVEGLVEQFTNLTKENPLNKFFVDPSNCFLTHKGVKPMEELPKFTAPPQVQYEQWTDYLGQAALAALLEQRPVIPDQKYNATVAMVPIPATKKRDANVFMAYRMQASIERDPFKPRLMPGDHVTIDLNPDPEAPNASEENRWYGKVTHPTNATPMGMNAPSRFGLMKELMMRIIYKLFLYNNSKAAPIGMINMIRPRLHCVM